MKSLGSAEVLAETRLRLLVVREDDRARWGKMTAQQMVRHLGCACEVALGERVVGPVKGIPQGVVKFLALRSGVRWAKNIQSTPELLKAIEESPGIEFEVLLREAVEKMEAMASGRQLVVSHPFFGQMSKADWMRWGYLHADHHLRQFGR